MAIADYATYVSEVNAPYQNVPYTKVAFGSPTAGRWSSLWATAEHPGLAPTGGSVPARTLTGSYGQSTASGGVMRIGKIDLSCNAAGVLVICDRLSHMGGLNASLTGGNGPSAVNLPTTPLTRFTGGVGVFAGLEIYTQIGAVSTYIQASYTNQAGVAGKITPSTNFGNAGFREANKILILPLAEGDTGFRSIESLAMPTGSGTAGNYGVTLFKPLFYAPVLYLASNIVFDSIQNCFGMMPKIDDNACLFLLFLPNGATAPIITVNTSFIQE